MSIFSIKKINGFERKSPRRIESPSNTQFLVSLLHVWNGVVVLIECAIFLPVIYGVERWRRRRNPQCAAHERITASRQV